MGYRLLLFFVFLSVFADSFSQAKRALNYVEKLRYDQAEEVLIKSLEKDSLDAAEKYVYSLLYFTSDYPNYDYDSAYTYVLLAISSFENSDDKKIEKLTRDGFTMDIFKAQKQAIEDYTFSLAKSANAEADYILFLEKYPSSDRADSAIWYRNVRAFESAVKRNSWERYKSFMDRYPEAEQYEEAKEKFQLLIYKDKTSDGKLASFEKFLVEFPGTPYHKEIDRQIFIISTAPHSLKGYLDFIEKYPDSKMVATAVNRISLIQDYNQLSTTLPEILALTNDDSIRILHGLNQGFVFPIYQNGLYTFLDENGSSVSGKQFTRLPAEYTCGNIEDQMLTAGNKEQMFIINRAGHPIYEASEITAVVDLGAGVLKFNLNGLFGAMLKTGFIILPAEFEDIRVLQNQYVGFKNNGKWGLTSVNKLSILEPTLDDISDLGQLIRLEKGDTFNLMLAEELEPALDGNPIQIEYNYSDAEILDDNRMILYSDDQQSLVSSTLEVIIAMEKQEIIDLNVGQLIENERGYRFLPDSIELNPALIWSNAEYNKEWIGLQGKNGWVIASTTQNKILEEYVDSLQLLNNSTCVIFKNGQRELLFSSGTKINLAGGRTYQVLSSPPTTSSTPAHYYLIHEKKETTVLNQVGDTLELPRYNTINPLGNEYLVLSYARKKGLIDLNGEVLLEAEFDGIANYNSGSVTTLKDGKIGLYRLSDRTNIPTSYNKSLSIYNDSLFIAQKGATFGLIDRSNSVKIAFNFTDLQYFNDSAAWVQTEEGWGVYNFYENRFELTEITEFSDIAGQQTDYLFVQTEEGKGVLHRKNGMIINTSFNNIVNIGSTEIPVFLAEIFVEEADFHVVVIYDMNGEIIFRNAYDSMEYTKVVCEEESN